MNRPSMYELCEVCRRWLRRDHRCPGPVVPVASTRRLPKLVHP